MRRISNSLFPIIWGLSSVLIGILFIVLNVRIIDWILLIVGLFLVVAGSIPMVESIIQKKRLPLIFAFVTLIGIIILVFKNQLVAILFILMGILLILAGIKGIDSLINIRRTNALEVSFVHFLMPILCIIGGVVAIWNPFGTEAILIGFIGWCIFLNGFFELFSLLVLSLRG